MHLVASVCLCVSMFVCMFVRALLFTLKFRAKEDHYQSVNFLCASVNRQLITWIGSTATIPGKIWWQYEGPQMTIFHKNIGQRHPKLVIVTVE